MSHKCFSLLSVLLDISVSDVSDGANSTHTGALACTVTLSFYSVKSCVCVQFSVYLFLLHGTMLHHSRTLSCKCVLYTEYIFLTPFSRPLLPFVSFVPLDSFCFCFHIVHGFCVYVEIEGLPMRAHLCFEHWLNSPNVNFSCVFSCKQHSLVFSS